MNHYLIIADGEFLAKEIILEAAQNRILLALDAAADRLYRIGIIPNIILGDFDMDSPINREQWGIIKTHHGTDEAPYFGKKGVTIVPRFNQNDTDLIKGIRYCNEMNATSIHIICATGGRLDHHEATLRALRSEYKKNRCTLLYTEQQCIRFARDEKVILQGEVGDKCGIFAYPKAIFSSRGLAYDVLDYPLEFAISESIANALAETSAEVNITGDALLIMPAQLLSQRQFMQKTRRERLEILLRDV